jgi:hypothetical protein
LAVKVLPLATWVKSAKKLPLIVVLPSKSISAINAELVAIVPSITTVKVRLIRQ